MVRRKQGWLTAKVGDELVMMSARSGEYLGVNSLGARIWELIETPMDLDALCARLVGEFEVTEDACRAQVEAFLADLEARGAVTQTA